MYLHGPGAPHTEYDSPMETDSFAGGPDAYIETAEFDCLHDDGTVYAERLAADGCGVEINETKGTVHGFDIISGVVRECVNRRVGALIKVFERK